MPGSSLWLLPPSDHPLNKLLPALIQQTSQHFNSTHLFLPHVTLTSEISPSTYGADTQAWLDSLTLPKAGGVHVKFRNLGSENVFFRKLYIKCEKNHGILELGNVARCQVTDDDREARKWAEDTYMPHCSLLYHDCPRIDADGLAEVESLAEKLEIELKGEGSLSGWAGGRVVLVPTDKSIEEWKPIAERVLE